MRSYERFAEDVLWRIEKAKKERHHRRRVVGAVAAMGAAFVLVTAVSVSLDRPLTATPSQPLTETVVLPSYSAVHTLRQDNDGIRDAVMAVGDTMDFAITATDVSGFSEEEIRQMMEERREEQEKVQIVWAQQGYTLRSSALHLDDTLISYLATNGFLLQVEDWNEVTEVTAACSSPYGQMEVGILSPSLAGKTVPFGFMAADGSLHQAEKPVNGDTCWVYGQKITLPGEVCRTVYKDVQSGKGRLTLAWKPSAELLQTLAEDPTFTLPEHTATFAVAYQNGRTEVHTLTVHYADGVGIVRYDGVTVIPS